GHMIVLGDVALCLAENNQLWRTDGTSTGTFLVKVLSNIDSSNLVSFIRFGSQVYFATGPDASSTLWKTDGTTEGTIALNPTIYRNASSVFPAAAVYNNMLYYRGCQGTTCTLWSTDGSNAGAAIAGTNVSR